MAIIIQEPIQIISIFPIENNRIFVQWDLDTDQTGFGTFTFNLYRSGSPEGPFETVATSLTVSTYSDALPLLQGMNKDIFYKVVASPGGYTSPVRSILSGLSRKKYLIWRKIVNDERVLLRKGNGIEVKVLKKKHWGARCTHCFDTRSNQTVKRDCAFCFGTSFDGGFFPTINTWAHINPEVLGVDPTAPTAIPEVLSPTAFIQAYPIVKKGDILVEPEVNRRWEIVAVQDTEILRNRVHQDITISRLPTDHIIYKLAVA